MITPDESDDQVEQLTDCSPVAQDSSDGVPEIAGSTELQKTSCLSTLWTCVRSADEQEILESGVSLKDMEAHHGVQPTVTQRYRNPSMFDPLKVI